MRALSHLAALVSIALLASCAVPSAQQQADSSKAESVVLTPAQAQRSVFVSKNAFLAGLQIVKQYQRLQPCPSRGLCKETAVEQRLVKLSNAASDVLDEAEKGVRTPGYGSDKLTTIVISANAATKALTIITDSLKTE